MLRRRNLHRAVMRFCGLSCSDLREADFSHSELTGCDLSAADLSTANFARADLRGADLSRAMLHQTRFNEAQLGPYRPEGGEARVPRMSGATTTGPSSTGPARDPAAFAKAHLHPTERRGGNEGGR